MRRIRAIAPLTLLALATPCIAQSDSAGALRWCWRGKPAPECTAFWITEFGVDASTSSTETIVSENYGGGNVYRYAARDFESRFTWTIGPMFNTGPRSAMGGTLSISPLSRHYRAALEARRRWWRTQEVGVDLSAGALKMSVPNRAGTGYRDEYGLTAAALVAGGDLVNVNGRVDLLVTGGRPRYGTSIGLAGGSYVAVVGSVALGLLILAYISAGPID